MKKDPCDTCLRWPECNGVDANTCPLCKWEEQQQQPKAQKPYPLDFDEKTESGLLTED